MTSAPDKQTVTLPDVGEEKPFPEYDSAIEKNKASFVQLVEAYYYQKEEWNEDDPHNYRMYYRRYYPKLVDAFEHEHGAITHFYASSQVMVASVLTDNDEIHMVTGLVGNRGLELEIRKLLAQCEKLSIDAHQLPEGRDRRTSMEMIYSVVSDSIGVLDNAKQEEETTDNMKVYSPVLDHLRNELGYARRYYERCTQRNAQFKYFAGMVLGLLVLAGIVFLIAWAISRVGNPDLAPVTFLGSLSLVAGGTGAMVSVMSRMTFGRLTLQYQAGSILLYLLGAFRPLIGGIIGLALNVLIVGTLLPIAQPAEVAKQVYFYLGIAFIAGFSERWAQDMLAVAKGSASPGASSTSQSESPSPSGGPPPPQ